MKTPQANIDVIRHILRYCDDIDELIERFGKSYEVFEADKAYFNSVSMCILQIGELTTHLSDEYRTATKDIIPWQAMKAMRNLFAHNYMEMSKRRIWATATEDIPNVKEFCERQIKIGDLLQSAVTDPEEINDIEM